MADKNNSKPTHIFSGNKGITPEKNVSASPIKPTEK